MPFEPWMLAAMEEAGYTDTNEGLINRVARYLARSPNDTINTAEFRQACVACNVDPDSFTQNDLDKLQKKLYNLPWNIIIVERITSDEINIKSAKIKDAIAYELKHNTFGKSMEMVANIYKHSSVEEIAMYILWGYVKSLHIISESPEVNIGIDLTYQTAKNAMEAVAYEFSSGMNPQSGYSIEKNIEIAEKTIAAYFMFLAINDDTAEITIDPQIDKARVFAPDCWTGITILLRGRLIRCDLLQEIHGTVTYVNGTLTIDAEKLISSY